MKFLSISLRALGLNDKKALDPSSKLLLALMDMFGEMGDRIAVQYGGSEAHKKMAAGTGQAASSSKQGELLTSIKRYYRYCNLDCIDANVFFIPINSIDVLCMRADEQQCLH
jgi:hypothetical protein